MHLAMAPLGDPLGTQPKANSVKSFCLLGHADSNPGNYRGLKCVSLKSQRIPRVGLFLKKEKYLPKDIFIDFEREEGKEKH